MKDDRGRKEESIAILAQTQWVQGEKAKCMESSYELGKKKRTRGNMQRYMLVQYYITDDFCIVAQFNFTKQPHPHSSLGLRLLYNVLLLAFYLICDNTSSGHLAPVVVAENVRSYCFCHRLCTVLICIKKYVMSEFRVEFFLSDPNAETRDRQQSKSVCLLPENSEAGSEEGWQAGWNGNKVRFAGGSAHK